MTQNHYIFQQNHNNKATGWVLLLDIPQPVLLINTVWLYLNINQPGQLTPSAAFITDLESDAVSSWSKWSWMCSRYRLSSCHGSPASVPWLHLSPAPSWSALWCLSGAPGSPGRIPPLLQWMQHQPGHPAPAWKTLWSLTSFLCVMTKIQYMKTWNQTVQMDYSDVRSVFSKTFRYWKGQGHLGSCRHVGAPTQITH